jgi:hypothetical protein
MKIVLWIIASLALLISLSYLRGVLLPSKHVAQLQRHIDAPLVQVAARIADLGAQPNWRSTVSTIESSNGAVLYREKGSNGTIRFKFQTGIASANSQQFLSTIDDPELAFGGQWTFQLTASANGTEVSIREDGTVRSPIFRFVAHDLLGYERTIRQYLDDLERSCFAVAKHETQPCQGQPHGT